MTDPAPVSKGAVCKAGIVLRRIARGEQVLLAGGGGPGVGTGVVARRGGDGAGALVREIAG